MAVAPGIAGEPVTCPACGGALAAELAGAHALRRCEGCRGIWVDPATFRALCEVETAQGGAPEDRGGAREGATPSPGPVRYRSCPACGQVLRRTQFAHASGIVIDVCRRDGAFLDAGELRAIRRFVRSGGLERARRLAAAREEAERSRERPGAPPRRIPAYDDPLWLVEWLARMAPPRGPLANLALGVGLLALGGAAVWAVFGPGSHRLEGVAALAAVGVVALLAAHDLLRDAVDGWRERRRRG